MNMKDHILTALNEQFQRWVQRLDLLSAEQASAPLFDGDWSIKDVMMHLWGWQQITIARVAAAVEQKEPEFPAWVDQLGAGWEGNADQANAWLYRTHHDKPWPEVYQTWRAGYLRLISLGEQVAERDLLEGGKYHWLGGYSLALILLASYNHHQEHLDRWMMTGPTG